MQVSEPPFVGDWMREKKLGAGGFGVVTLWRNTKTKQRVAVKRCHPPAVGDQHADNVRRRWHLEVDYMTEKVSHPNIVRGVRVEPATFLAELERQQPTAMPVLLMEYCEGGDLRRLLNTSEYATGFPEREARDVLRSLGAAIAYLHKMKITHRDIKPENIVVKRDAETGRQVYKLTDLGYAKALDQHTLVASLVGTLEYIAPELCLTDRYTNTVDYWSLGVIAYEIVTGVRPFVPHVPLARWMGVVKNKKSVHIAITEGQQENDIIYESQLPAEHRLSAALAALLEPWLRLALEWNPKQRGHAFKRVPVPAGVAATGDASKSNQLPPQLELRIFTQLDSVLNARILRLFCLNTYRAYSVELCADMRMEALLAWISRATHISKDSVRLLLPVGHPWGNEEFTMETLPAVLCWPDHDGPMLYVYEVLQSKTKAAAIAGEMPLPDVVRDVLDRQKQHPPQSTPKWRPHVVRRFATAAFHACRREQQRYRDALNGWYTLALRLDHRSHSMQTRVDEMLRMVWQLDGSVRTVGETMGLLAAPDALRDEFDALSERTRLLLTTCDHIAHRYKSVNLRSHDACHLRLLERRNDGVDLFGVERTAQTLEILRIQLQQKAAVEQQLRDMQYAVEACQLKRAELLLEKEWTKLQEYPHMTHEIEEIHKTLENAIAAVKPYQLNAQALNARLIEGVQAQVAATAAQNYLPAIDGIGATTAATESGVNFQIGKAVTPPKQSETLVATVAAEQRNASVLPLGDRNTSTLITNNEEILSRMESMIHQMNEDLLASDSA